MLGGGLHQGPGRNLAGLLEGPRGALRIGGHRKGHRDLRRIERQLAERAANPTDQAARHTKLDGPPPPGQIHERQDPEPRHLVPGLFEPRHAVVPPQGPQNQPGDEPPGLARDREGPRRRRGTGRGAMGDGSARDLRPPGVDQPLAATREPPGELRVSVDRGRARPHRRPRRKDSPGHEPGRCIDPVPDRPQRRRRGFFCFCRRCCGCCRRVLGQPRHGGGSLRGFRCSGRKGLVAGVLPRPHLPVQGQQRCPQQLPRFYH
mmetsp:Transcript_21511/g.45363  ORF Transcript_21511/g.45363 Transcript_21511/m.45363 type:complete len:261 (-) Transcript_21511:635-1417(-)